MKYAKREEVIVDELSALYKNRGFKRYKPGCFEEYSLYQDNKDFLIGKNVISFSDLSGKLMAMRPDVTLSLVRHIDVENGATEKFYYSEKVYRQATGGKNYKEISQLGVEVVGAIDLAVVAELTIMICQTLAAINDNYVLDVSHMGYTEGLLSEFGVDKQLIAEYLKSKNLHDFNKFADGRGYSDAVKKAFYTAVSVYENADLTLQNAEKAALNDSMKSAVAELKELYAILKKFGYAERINIDFSACGNADYYNGVIFNGYLKGVPHSVLTGGRYDRLLTKLDKNGGAIGFALYLGEIERCFAKDDETVDYLIIYDSKTQIAALDIANEKNKLSQTVRLSGCLPAGVIYKNIIDLTGKEAIK